MTIQEYDRKMEESESTIKSLREQMKGQCEQFTKAVIPAMTEWMNKTIRDELVSQAKITNAFGDAAIKQIADELKELLASLPDLIEKEIPNNSQDWSHLQDYAKLMTYSLSDGHVYSEQPHRQNIGSLPMAHAIRRIQGKAASFLFRYKYDVDHKVYKPAAPDGHYIYNGTPVWSDDMTHTLKGYSALHKQLLNEIHALRRLRSDKEKAIAKDKLDKFLP